MNFLFIATLIFSLNISIKSQACSVVSVSDRSRTVTGYTMEWVGRITDADKDLDKYVGGGIFLLPAGLSKKAVLSDTTGARWIAKYNSVVFSTLGPAMGFNGINEKGLEVYALGTANLVRDMKSGPTVSELDSISYILDTAQNVTEAITALNKVKVKQILFPYQLFIKDSSGKAVIVDYLGSQRIHYPKPGKAFVTNGWYDAEQYKLDNGVRPQGDIRYAIIGKNATTPDSIDDVLYKVGSDNTTMWQTLVDYNGEANPTLIVHINPYGGFQKPKKTYRFDLENLFHRKNFSSREIKFVLFSDFFREQSPQFRILTREDDRKIQEANFHQINDNQNELLYRNEEKNAFIQSFFFKIYDGVKIAPITNLIQ